MRITISTKNISLDDALRIFVEDKVGGLEKFLTPHLLGGGDLVARYNYFRSKGAGLKDPNNLVEVRVEIGKPSKHHRSGRIYYAEVNLKMGGKLLRATCQHEDLRNAIIDVKNELQQQIKKLKGKSTDLSRKPKI